MESAHAGGGAVGAAGAPDEWLRAVNHRLDGVESRIGRLEKRFDGFYRALWLQAAGIVVAVVALVKLLPSP